MSRLHWLTTGCLVALGTAALASSADATPRAPRLPALTVAEREALWAGDVVSRPMSFTTEEGSYRGGVSYSLVQAPPEAVLAALCNVSTLPMALPRTRSARLIDRQGGLSRIELVQAGDTTYTVNIERSPTRSELRFWLDPSRPHDISDVFGFFRVDPFPGGRSLVTVAAALDLGTGLTSLLFSDAVQRALLSTPGQIRDFVEPRAIALLEAPPGSIRGF